MPLTAKGEKILASFKREYGPKEGERYFYAAKNAGTITGIDEAAAAGEMEPSYLRRLIRDLTRFFHEEAREPQHQGADAEKLTKAAVDYSPGNANDRCKNCLHFAAPHACAIVEGIIDPDYWCREFSARQADDESRETKERDEGKLSQKERETASEHVEHRRDMPEGAFLQPEERKYPVKVERDGAWHYDRGLLLAAAREARMHGHEAIAKRADEIREREFGSANDMALDRSSARSYDADGRLHVAGSNISKATVNPYFGREIPDYEKLGLDPERKYRLLRHPDELKKAVDTFNNLPVLSKHVPVSAESHQPDLVIGSTGTDAEYDEPYLRNSLVFWAGPAIDAIESGDQRQLSSAYRYRADMTPGEYEGQPYDGVMRDIVGNHVALVKEGRAGPDVLVGDSKENENMAQLSAAIHRGAIVAFLMPKMAFDAKKVAVLDPLIAGLTPKNFPARKALLAAGLKGLAVDADVEEIGKLLIAMDEVDPNGATPMAEREDDDDEDETYDKRAKDARRRLGRDETEEERDERETKEAAEDARKRLGRDETDEERDEREAKDRKARDARRARDAKRAKDAEGAGEKDEKEEPVSKSAMDAAIARATRDTRAEVMRVQNEVREAERAVRPYVGELAMAHDSAEAVYRTALSVLGVDSAGISEVKALRTILELQPKPGARREGARRVAMDAAAAKSFAERHPNAAGITVL